MNPSESKRIPATFGERSSRAQASERSDRRVRMSAQTSFAASRAIQSETWGSSGCLWNKTRFPFPYSDRFKKSLLFRVFFGLVFGRVSGAILDPFRRPKTMKNPSKIRCVFWLIFRWISDGFREAFGDPFGRILETKIVAKIERFLIGFLDGFWGGFGRHSGQIWPPKVNKNLRFFKQWESVKNSTSCRRELDFEGLDLYRTFENVLKKPLKNL